MKYLVTGGAGFIGSNLVEALVRQGNMVRVLDNFSTGKRENLAAIAADTEVVEGDIRDYGRVCQALQGVDVILHQAALPSVPRSIEDPLTSNEVNVTGTLNILNGARQTGVRRVVYASSSSVYGDNPELPKHEEMALNPLSPYAVSKMTAERYCSVFSRLYGLETIALRYFNVFGPRQDPTSQYSAVIPKFIRAMMADERPVVYGDGEQSRDFTYVSNVVEANLAAVKADCPPGMVFNCATHSRITLNQLIDAINRILGKNIKPVYQEPRPGDVMHSFASIGKMEKLLGYSPKMDFNSGLRLTCQYYSELGRE